MSIKSQSYLYPTPEGVWMFQIFVPKYMRHIFGGKKLYRKSTGTKALSCPRRHQRVAPYHPAEHERQRFAGQRTGIPRHVRAQPSACHGDACAGILQREEPYQRGAQGFLRIPLHPYGALGRTCRTALQRRTLCRRHARPQRTAPRPLPHYTQRHHGSGQRSGCNGF